MKLKCRIWHPISRALTLNLLKYSIFGLFAVFDATFIAISKHRFQNWLQMWPQTSLWIWKWVRKGVIVFVRNCQGHMWGHKLTFDTIILILSNFLYIHFLLWLELFSVLTLRIWWNIQNIKIGHVFNIFSMMEKDSNDLMMTSNMKCWLYSINSGFVTNVRSLITLKAVYLLKWHNFIRL